MTALRAFKLDPAQLTITEEEILADLTYPVRKGAPLIIEAHQE